MLYSILQWKTEDAMPKLFIGNIPSASSELELRRWVESNGIRIESVEIIYDRTTGKHRGFGFLSLRDEAEVQRAIIALNGQRMEGRLLTVNKAVPISPVSERFPIDRNPKAT
jgi:RNA recognition motif-containing protein